MKRLILGLAAAAALMLVAGVVVAQANTGSAASSHGQQMKQIFEKLGLTPQQKTQVKAILVAAHQQAQNAKDPAAKRQIFKEALKKIRDTVLTAAQREKFKELLKQFKGQHTAANATKATQS